MKKLIVLLMGFLVIMPTFAEDTEEIDTAEEVVVEESEAVVVDRTSCADIQAQISELSDIEDPDEETVFQISTLKADYRRLCSRAAGKRRASAKRGVVDIPAAPATVATATSEDASSSDKKSEMASESVETTEKDAEKIIAEAAAELPPEIDAEALYEQEMANLEAGLCADGSAPNKYGCCAGEIFKDLGNNEYGCCPKSGGKCLTPIKQGF